MASHVDAMRTAVGLHQAGRLSEAEQIYRQVLDQFPSHADALHLLGVAAMQSGRLELAVQYIGQAIAARPDQPVFYNSLGDAFRAAGNLAVAQQLYERALSLAPDHAGAQHNLGLVREALRQAGGGPLPEPRADAQTLCMNASHQHRCLFLHVPKNGGTSIKKALDMPGGGHPTWQVYANNYPDIWRNYASFAVVRNPWDRAVSAYHQAKMKESHWHNEQMGMHLDYRLLHNKTFEQCVVILSKERPRLQHDSWKDQSQFIVDTASPERRIMVGTLLRFETLAEDFNHFCRAKGIQCEPLPSMNVSDRSRDYRQYFNDQTRQMIEEVYAEDIKAFGYTF
jgi:chondroitin 4-sulfotransferase 11